MSLHSCLYVYIFEGFLINYADVFWENLNQNSTRFIIQDYSFDPVSLIPWMKVFWAKKKAITIGIVKTVAAAMS